RARGPRRARFPAAWVERSGACASPRCSPTPRALRGALPKPSPPPTSGDDRWSKQAGVFRSTTGRTAPSVLLRRERPTGNTPGKRGENADRFHRSAFSARTLGRTGGGPARGSSLPAIEEPLLGGEPHVLGRTLAALEHDHGGHAAHAVLTRRDGRIVDVELADLDRSDELVGHLIDDGRERLAGPAPGRRKVDEDRYLGGEDLLLEVQVV